MPTVSMRQLLGPVSISAADPPLEPEDGRTSSRAVGIHIIDWPNRQGLGPPGGGCHTVARGEQVLFVGTEAGPKPIAQEAAAPVSPTSTSAGSAACSRLTTIKKRIALMEQLGRARRTAVRRMTRRKPPSSGGLTKLTAVLGGIRRMKRLPGAIFVVDPHRERIAVTEANKLGSR